MKRLMRLALVAGAVAYLRDPERRRTAIGRAKSLFGGRAQGVVEKAKSLRGGDAADVGDVELARSVETEIFRDAEGPKGTVDVNVRDGVVQLRGEVERPDLIDDLVAKARAVEGVKEVESFLHAPQGGQG